jgi:hypothetical protein
MRFMLDNNVWTYIGERNLASDLEHFEERSPELTHVVPPSVLLEAVRTPIADIRDRIVRAMTSRRRERVHPFPEARQEANELVAMVGQTRARWLREFAEPTSVSRLEAFWTRRLWQLAADDPSALATAERATDDGASEIISQVQQENRRVALENDFRLTDSEPWTDLTGMSRDLTVGWDGKRFESWRLESSLLWWHQLIVVPRRRRPSTYADWTRPWLDLERVARDRGDWNRFWYSDTTAHDLPRIWMRSVLPWAQLQGKVGGGDPRDAQHAAYLFDIDVFVTADRRFARALELLRKWTPLPFADVEVIPADGDTVARIEAVLSRRTAQR